MIRGVELIRSVGMGLGGRTKSRACAIERVKVSGVSCVYSQGRRQKAAVAGGTGSKRAAGPKIDRSLTVIPP